MSDEGGTISADGVTVEKSLDRDQFKTPAVTFEIRSSRDEQVTVGITDQIPDGIPIEDVGFHPEYGGDSWSIEDHGITFRRTFDPGEEYETIYGVRGVDGDDIEALLDQSPSLEVGEPEESLDAVDVEDVVGEGDDVVRDVITGERDSLPDSAIAGAEEAAGADAEPILGEEASTTTPEADADEEEGVADAEEDEPAAGTGEPALADTEPTEKEGLESSGEGEVSPGTSPERESVAAALAAELRAGTVDESDERALRDALGAGDESRDGAATGSLEARIEHLQSEVSELTAYTEALETFLDEHGGGDGVLDDVQAELADVTSAVAGLEDRIDDLDDLEATVDDLDAEVTVIDQDLAEAEDEVEELRGDVDAVTEDVDRLETDVDDLLYLEEDVDELHDLAGDVDAIETEVEDLREEHERMDDLDDRLAGIEDAVENLQSDMDEMKTFRDRLSSAFGPGEADEEN